jgi:hypothetical protein
VIALPRPENRDVIRRRFTRFRYRIPALAIAALFAAALWANPAAAADKQRPSIPRSLTRTAATEETMSLSWRASTDNVGVKGYRVFRNGTLVATLGNSLSYVMNGLHCNTSYIVAVSAYDAAGNRSLPAAIFAKTAACGSDVPACPTPNTVFRLLLEHQIQYGCTWPGGIYARQAIQSVRIMLAGRGITLDTWRARKWHAIALHELNAAANMANAWTSQGVLRANSQGVAVQYKLGRVIRILQWHNAELSAASKAEKWALTAISWYIAASEYNRHFALIGGSSPDMTRALGDLRRADADFFATVCYRAWGRYRQVWQRVTGLPLT